LGSALYRGTGPISAMVADLCHGVDVPNA
jgi:hypothetical protein